MGQMLSRLTPIMREAKMYGTQQQQNTKSLLQLNQTIEIGCIRPVNNNFFFFLDKTQELTLGYEIN